MAFASRTLTPNSSCDGTIDVSVYLLQMERVLMANDDRQACARALAALERWQFDSMLDEKSRQKARRLVLRFGSKD